jgi:cysteinyl-tRNA synthetase
MSEITEKFARIYNEDLAALNCLEPTYQPKATEHIGDMIAMISKLLDDGVAYASDGHVFFDVAKYPDYGQLSGNTLDALRGGDRVGEGEVARKKNAADFVLWKPELNGVGWDAPFGRGRPGWHIECSAMAKATLKTDVIDIHCGGVDLKFPHHENERAQSCCANDASEFAKFWVHNEFLNMGKDKMSKSLGNVTLVRDLLKDWDGEVIRLALLKAHYRSELSWSEDLLCESKAQLDGWYRRKLDFFPFKTSNTIKSKDLMPLFNDLRTHSFSESLGDITKKIDRDVSHIPDEAFPLFFPDELPENHSRLVAISNLLGLLQRDPEAWFRGNASDSESEEFDAIAKRRETARAAKDWAAADAARDEATARGIVLEDGPDGTTWRKA